MRMLCALVAITILGIFVMGCTKDKVYIQHPTCRRFIEVRDTADVDMTYIRTDTLHPAESPISQIACNNTLIEMQNYIPYWEGCANNGYERYRYLIQ